uniref:AT-hook motif nuclear-localized protein n=1 Tax=Fagus sylvatica TaxID=28930 RepID=A0A2N9EFN0_FAGSY
MEPNDNQLTSYFHHHHLQNPISTTAPSPTNGLLPPGDSTSGAHLMYPHPSAVTTTNAITTSTTTATNTNTTAAAAATTSSSPLEGKRKRGRPRKYGTPEQALAAKKGRRCSKRCRNSTAAATNDVVSLDLIFQGEEGPNHLLFFQEI